MRRALGVSVLAGCLAAYSLTVVGVAATRPAAWSSLSTKAHVVVAHPGGQTGGAVFGDPGLSLIHAEEAWQVAQGDPSTRVAVIDTGIDYTHPDLQGRMVGGVDLGDGDDDPMDEIGHGTAVAGIIATVCPRCSLVGIKIFNQQGLGTPYALLRRRSGAAIRWAVNDGARVINVSNSLPRSSDLLAAVDYAQAHGAVVVAAAGNGDDWQGVYPAAYGPVVSVGAADPTTGARYPYSAFGPFLDITAPGLMVTDSLGGQYTTFGGTSAAAPVVSGALGLLFSLHPELTAAEAVSLLAATSRDVGVPGADDDYGAGVVDANALVRNVENIHYRAACALSPPTHGLGFLRPIVFVSSCGGNFDVYSMLQDGRDVRRLTTSAALDRHPALSSQGRRIAFLRGDFAQDDLYLMRSDGSDVRRLTHFNGGVEAPAWSPDSSVVAFSAYDRQGSESKGSDIYTIRPDGTHLHRVTRLGFATNPSWSPDGKRIVFSTGPYGDLWVMTANGASSRRLTHAPNGVRDVSPSWSPDGKRIAFARRDGSSGDVFVVDANGSHLQQLTRGGDCRSPAWTPSGKKILFSGRYGANPDLFSISANGSDLQPLLQTSASEVEVGSSSTQPGGPVALNGRRV
jgi:Tol biopolymer transport system component